MATNNSQNSQFANNADGYTLGGGTTSRNLTITGGNVTLTGAGSNTYTMPSSSDTLLGRTSVDTVTNKDLTSSTNTFPSTTLGYAEITTGQGSITTLVDITGLSVTVTTNGSRRIKITGYTPGILSTVAGDSAYSAIYEGSTRLNFSGTGWIGSGALEQGTTVLWSGVPTSGSHTYKISCARYSGTGVVTFDAGAGAPAFILVEYI